MYLCVAHGIFIAWNIEVLPNLILIASFLLTAVLPLIRLKGVSLRWNCARLPSFSAVSDEKLTDDGGRCTSYGNSHYSTVISLKLNVACKFYHQDINHKMIPPNSEHHHFVCGDVS